jgi:hypothetical protein
MMVDPLGEDYWSFDCLTDAQKDIAAALTDDWKPLRVILQKTKADGSRPKAASARSNWEKLCVLGLLNVDAAHTKIVRVRRGDKWKDWWEQHGDLINGLQAVKAGFASVDEVL